MKTEELNDRVKELNDYFVGKLVDGSYEVIERGDHTVEVDIDGFRFNIWIANGESGVKTYFYGFDGNFMRLSFDESQKTKIYRGIVGDDNIQRIMEEIQEAEIALEVLRAKLKMA